MASKNDSNWLDNTKVRTELYNFVQAIKSVYSHFRYDDGITIPLTMECIKSRPLFDNSFFIRTGGTHFDMLQKAAVDADELNVAIKTKAFEYKKIGNKHLLCKEGTEHVISVDMNEDQLDDMKNYKALLEYRSLRDIEPIGSYTLDLEDIGLLSLYHVVTRDIAKDGNKVIPLIMTKELFPMLKRAEAIIIDVYKTDDLPNNIYEIVIRSQTKTWTFNSIHKIIVA